MNKIKSKFSKGFSLVELLIVITIIGVLSTIILSSVSNSRARAYDSKVKQQLSSFRTAAEVYFTNQNNYGPSVSACTAGIFSDIDPVNGSPGLFIDPANLPSFTQVVCGSDGSSYAVKASLYSGNEYWCVDNTGASRLIAGAVGTSATFCP